MHKKIVIFTFFAPGTRSRSVSKWELTLARRFLSASQWFFKAATFLSADTPFLGRFIVASTSSPLSLSKTNEEDDEEEKDPFLVLP